MAWYLGIWKGVLGLKVAWVGRFRENATFSLTRQKVLIQITDYKLAPQLIDGF